MRALKGRLGPGVCPLVRLRGQPHFLLHLIVLWSLMLCGPFASVPRREPKAGRSLVDPCWERLGMWHFVLPPAGELAAVQTNLPVSKELGFEKTPSINLHSFTLSAYTFHHDDI